MMVGAMRFFSFLLVLCLVPMSASGQAPYRLQPGDTIEVSVFQEPDLGRQVLVGPDGRISFPLVGQVRVGGQTVGSIENTLKQRLDAYYKEALDVTVLLVGTKEALEEDELIPTVYITGEVARPGAFEIKNRTTVLQALALSGGLSPYAAKKRILVRRNIDGEDVVFPFDYTVAEKGLPVASDIGLRHGDVIIVPERGLFE